MQITAAVAATEREITDDVFSDEPLDLDGDTSLEDMGDGLEGDDLIEDGDEETDEGDTDEGEGEDEGDDEGEGDLETDEGDESGEGEDEGDEGDIEDDQRQPVAADDQRGRMVPRSRVKEEADKKRDLEAQLIEMRGAMTVLQDIVSGRAQTQQQQTQEPEELGPEPDQFVYPDEWRAWNAKNTQKLVRDGIAEGINAYRQETQAERLVTVNENLEAAAEGKRGVEFKAAYQKLMSLPKTPEVGRFVQSILHSRNPAQAVFNWWESNGGPEFREQALRQMADSFGLELPPEVAAPAARTNGQRPAPQHASRNQPQNGQPRQVFRGPQRIVTRSLNGAPGGVRQQIDPRGLDDSDASVASYVFSDQ